MIEYFIIAGSLFAVSLVFAWTAIKITQIKNPPVPPPRDVAPVDKEWQDKVEADLTALKIQRGIHKLRP